MASRYCTQKQYLWEQTMLNWLKPSICDKKCSSKILLFEMMRLVIADARFCLNFSPENWPAPLFHCSTCATLRGYLTLLFRFGWNSRKRRSCNSYVYVFLHHCVYYYLLSLCCYQGRIQKGKQGACTPPPIVDWVDFFTEKDGFVGTVISTRSVLWTSNMPKMRWRPGLRPGPHWGSSQAPLDSLVGWGGGHAFPNLHPSRRLWRLSRLGRSASVAPNVKSWLRRWLLILHCCI